MHGDCPNMQHSSCQNKLYLQLWPLMVYVMSCIWITISIFCHKLLKHSLSAIMVLHQQQSKGYILSSENTFII